MTFRADLQEVMNLQPAWSGRNTPEMARRGHLVRVDLANWLREQGTALAAAMGVPRSDLLVEGRDGTGMKTRVPWVRFAARSKSGRATEGFYVVYLWAFDGSAVFLSLNQGTTDFENGEFVRKPHVELESRVVWARAALMDWSFGRDDFASLELGDLGERSLGRGYELGDVAAIRYEAGAVPREERLLDDALSFARALGVLYDANERAPIPYEVPELEVVEEAAADAAGKPSRQNGAGFRQDAKERRLIELYAVGVARQYYEADGWKVKVKGAPYDLELRRGSERRTVEVKGTVSAGEAIPLTHGEVVHHAKAHPNNALVVVREIRLDRSTSPPTVSGGVLYECQPWKIDDELLRAISYKYTVPTETYGPGAGIEADDLLDL